MPSIPYHLFRKNLLSLRTEQTYALALFILLLATFSLIVSKLEYNSITIKNLSIYIIYLVSVTAITRVLKIVFNLISPKIGLAYEIVIHAIVYILSFTSVFLILFFNTMFDYGVMQLINGTDFNESIEFLSTYVLSIPSLFIFLLFASFFLIEYSLSKKLSKTKNKIRIHHIILFAILSVPIAFFCQAFTGNSKQNYDYVNHSCAKLLMYDPIFGIQNTYLQFQEINDISNIVKKKQDGLIASKKSKEPTNIILIIGESFNKYHSSLYGYKKETNPFLGKLYDEGSLFVFSDAITTYNRTATAIQNMMSIEPYSDTTSWYNGPLFPTIFKKAGYNVNFISNAFALSGATSFYRSEAFYLCDGVVSKKLFNYQNPQTTKYDHELIQNYTKKKESVEKSNNLIIFQLRGQHIDPSQRYPSDFEKFSASDINRPKLNNSEKQYIANYDNASLYNDKVIYDIITMYNSSNSIVIYLSDHGDEVYDFRNWTGRSYNIKEDEKEILHCQIDIPMMVYVSPLFKEKNPEIIRMIKKSINKKFASDDLPHFLFNIAQISTPYYAEERDLLSDKYTKKRTILNAIDYDKAIGDDKFKITYGL